MWQHRMHVGLNRSCKVCSHQATATYTFTLFSCRRMVESQWYVATPNWKKTGLEGIRLCTAGQLRAPHINSINHPQKTRAHPGLGGKINNDSPRRDDPLIHWTHVPRHGRGYPKISSCPQCHGMKLEINTCIYFRSS
jgi:hypothetical protein